MRARYFHYQLAELAAKALSKPAAFFLARGLALVYRHATADATALCFNLASALRQPAGSPQVRQAARRLTVNYSAYLVELCYADRLTPDFVAKKVNVAGLERLDRALSGGRGAVIVSGHVGNWEMGAMTLAMLGYPVSVVALTHRNAGIDSVFLRRRSHTGIRTLPLGRYLRPAFHALARNQIIAMNADRYYGGPAERAHFMGNSVLFPSGFARIAARAGAPLLPVFFIAEKGRYALDIRPAIDVTDPKAAVQAFAAEVESVVRRYPDQWYIFQRFTEEAIWPA